MASVAYDGYAPPKTAVRSNPNETISRSASGTFDRLSAASTAASRGGARAAQAAHAAALAARCAAHGVPPTPQLFERSLSQSPRRAPSPRGGGGGARSDWRQQQQPAKPPAGLSTGTIAAADPAFVIELDAGLKLGATHPSRFGEVVFGSKSPAAQRKYGDVPIEQSPDFKGRLGIPSHKYGARDPLVVGDCPPGAESAAASTWKSQVDEILYGTDLDGSGDYAKMTKAVENAPQYKGAAGVSSLAHAYDEPEHRVDVNTRIDMTYAVDAGVPAAGHTPGQPIREPVKVKRQQNQFQAESLFSKAGISNWGMNPKWKGAAPGRDEEWRPWHRQGKFFYQGSAADPCWRSAMGSEDFTRGDDYGKQRGQKKA